MKPVDFDYAAPTTLSEALALLTEAGEDARVLAGGQSLVPLLNLRLVRPRLVVDLRRVPGLAGIRPLDGGLLVGAMTRQADAETDPLVRERAPLLAEAFGRARIQASTGHRSRISGPTSRSARSQSTRKMPTRSGWERATTTAVAFMLSGS